MVVDVSDALSFDAGPVMEFFTTSTKNRSPRAGARGSALFAVSIVGCDRLPESGYMRAKVAQEELVDMRRFLHDRARTQFVEFTDTITASLTVGDRCAFRTR